MKPDRSQFTESDYDFSEVIAKSSQSKLSKSELQACHWYEYARESNAARSEIAALNRQVKQRKGKPGTINFGPRVRNQIQSFMLMSLSSCDGFPNTPWRRLSDKDKLPLLKMVVARPRIGSLALTWHNPPLLFALNEPGTTTLDMWKQRTREGRPPVSDTEPIKFGFFRVNLKYGHEFLIEEFKGYLRTFEGKAMVEFPPAEKKVARTKPPGRKSIPDALNALAAMRLRYHCKTFPEAQDKLEGTDQMRVPKRRDNFNRACDHAVEHFRKLFGWLDTAKPIHYTEGWRGGTQK